MNLAFVIPWFGANIPGGAEAECLALALRLRGAGLPVEVLTTCVRDFHDDWGRNHHRPGTEVLHGMTVRRFPVQPRDTDEFDRINGRLIHRLPVSKREESAFFREMLRCDELISFVEANQKQYVYAYMPYLFPTTFRGIAACPERSILIPCLHDECYAYLEGYRAVFQQARGLVFHSRAERDLARRLYGLPEDAGVLIGGGVESEVRADPLRFKERYQVGPFLLYVGRKDEEKNVSLLVDYFCRYKGAYPGDLKLVLIGEGRTWVPAGHEADVLDLGFLPAQDKHDALAAALAVCQPSLHESFSLVLMEAWAAETPVIVHEGCTVTRDHCLASNGGLFFSTFPDFVGCLDFLLDNPETAQRLGRNGRRYVLANYQWDCVVGKYLHAFRRWGFEFATCEARPSSARANY